MTTLLDYKKARFNYDILETFEAGIELVGHEVKAVKAGKGSLEGAYVVVRGGEAFVIGMLIQPYQENNTPSGYEPRRNRKLILSTKEIAKLADLEQGKGLTIVPISVYNKSHLVKVSVAVVRGKKQYDKRESIKKRETNREIQRELKDR